MSAYYHICDLEVSVKLGVYDAEKTHFVNVPVDIEYNLPAATKGQGTDDIADTVNYGAVCEAAIDAVSGKEFNLVEALVGTMYEALKNILPSGSALRITAHKKILPLSYVKGGVKYSYSEMAE